MSLFGDALNSSERDLIEREFGARIEKNQPVSGGCISSASYLLFENGKEAFLKVHNASGDMFEKEAHGLEELSKAKDGPRVPEVYLYSRDLIVMEWLGPGREGKGFYEDLGRGLANLHRVQNEGYGFFENNYIGSNPQINSEKNSWIDFFWTNRLLFQLNLAKKNKLATSELEERLLRLKEKLPELLAKAQDPPSLLHGDLWSGNVMTDGQGRPAIMDPAVYYGHREADLGMTMLFGGFPSQFYGAYQEAYPLNEGWRERAEIYNLYHLLNHVNLFGSSYLGQTMSILKRYT